METEVRRNTTDYELLVDGAHAGKIDLREHDGAVDLVHTEIDEAYGGQGLAGVLARGALDDLRARGAKAILTCPYVKGWVDKHPEYQDLVAQ